MIINPLIEGCPVPVAINTQKSWLPQENNNEEYY